MQEYLPILIFLIFSVVLACIMCVLPFIAARLRGGTQKLAPYECGFEEFEDARIKFNVKFLSCLYTVHHIRFGDSLFISMGSCAKRHRDVWVYIHDIFPWSAHRRVFV